MNIQEIYKKLIPATVIVIILITGLLYYNKIQNNKEIKKFMFVTELDPNLTAEERKTVEDRIAAMQEKINNPPEGSTDDEKYGWNMEAGAQKLVLGKFMEAKEYFLTASNLQPDNYTVYVALYQTFVNMTDYNSARDSIDKALSLVPNNADIWRKKIQLEKEKFNATNDQLEQLYTQAFESAGGNVDIATVYAQFLEETGDLKAAIEQWKNAVKAYPQGKELYQAEITRLEGLINK